MDKRGFEFLHHCKNQFKNHWQAFLNKELNLKQLELICFSWVIQHEDLYRNRPLATEPIQNPKTSTVNFKMVMKAWHLNCGSVKAENKSNRYYLKKAKKFFLDPKNKFEEGIALFEKHAEPEEIPF